MIITLYNQDCWEVASPIMRKTTVCKIDLLKGSHDLAIMDLIDGKAAQAACDQPESPLYGGVGIGFVLLPGHFKFQRCAILSRHSVFPLQQSLHPAFYGP